ncbi:MAG: helix-turn-helix transcriptional regulator, partial [Oscillospiraceae bacterium]|nr:helix-turn-helix transcriptional regulator [Oscillospiraceae bacterium]
LAMLIIVMDACLAMPPKWVRVLLVLVSLAAFLLAAGADAWGLYYKEVSFEVVDGTAVLVKVYGPLHSLYGAYLFLYFALMLACVAKAALHKPVQQSNYLLFLAAIVFSNLLVWLIEQMAEVRFEFLAVSYIVTELLLFLVHGMHKADAQREADGDADAAARQLPDDAMALLDSFAQKAASLTASERSILHLYAAGKDVAEVAELSFISIHTVRKHNMNIYRKLDVSSREELVLYIELLRRCGRLDALLKLPAHSERQ